MLFGCVVSHGVMAFSEGLKAVTRIGESTYIASHHDGNVLVRFDNSSTTIVVGSPLGAAGDVDGVGVGARLHGPQGLVATDGGRRVYFVDTFNSKVKRYDVESGNVSTVATLGPASPVSSNKQGSNHAPFPIAVDVDEPSRLAFVSNKYARNVVVVDLDAAEKTRVRARTPNWAEAYVGRVVSIMDLGCGELRSPHGVSQFDGRLLLADNDGGVKLADLWTRECYTLSGTVAPYFSFRGVSWVDASVALVLERKGPGTLYAWDVDTNRTHKLFGGGGEKHCWEDGRGLVAGRKASGFWKAMHVSYDANAYNDSILVADTGANYLRRLSVDPSDLFQDAYATTVPCFDTIHRFNESNAGTIEHAVCGLGDGPFPEQLPPCLDCMATGTFCTCDAYRAAPWCR